MKKQNQKIKDLIRSQKLKWTRPRRLVLEVFLKYRTPLRAADVHHKLASGEIDLASVYRTINLFSQSGILMSMDGGGEGKRYELSDAHRKHHHHLICQACGKAEDFEICLLGRLEKEIKKRTKFEVNRHELNFYGCCLSCQKKRSVLHEV